MANTIRLIEGFENSESAAALSAFPTSASAFVAGYGSGNALRIGNNGAQSISWRYVEPSNLVLSTTWIVVSFYFQRLNMVSSMSGFGFQIGNMFTNGGGVNNSSARMGVSFDVNGRVIVRKDGSGTDALTAGGIYSAGQWYHVEYRHRYGNASTGNFEVFLNGTSVLSGVGDNSGVATPTCIVLSGTSSVTAADHVYYDHIVAGTTNDATPERLNMCEVKRYLPTSTVVNGWTGSDADQVDNHLLVDDGQAASADYVQATAGTGLYDQYGHAAMASGRTPLAVQVNAAASTDIVGVDDYSMCIRSGATYASTRRSIGAGTAAWNKSDPFQTDPSTGAAWTKAGFDAMSFGVKS